MRVTESHIVEQTGLGKPDYSKKVSSGYTRAGFKLQYGQSLKLYTLVYSDTFSWLPFVRTPLPPGGTHTAANHATTMTDAGATFRANTLVGLTIVNVTDGSSGVITANTATTITVAALAGGTLNSWTTGDTYAIWQWIIDTETGLDMPAHVDIGHTWELSAFLSKMALDAKYELSLDGMYGGYLNYIEGGHSVYYNEVFAVSTKVWDPTGATAHDWGSYITNLGLADLYGGCSLWAIDSTVGTKPPSPNKTVKCKFCGHKWEVPHSTTKINCPQCGKLNCYFDLSQLREGA